MFEKIFERIRLKRKFAFFIDSVKTYYTFYALKRSLFFAYSESVWCFSFYDYYVQLLPPGYKLQKDVYWGEFWGAAIEEECYLYILEEKTGKKIDIMQLVYNRHSDWWKGHNKNV